MFFQVPDAPKPVFGHGGAYDAPPDFYSAGQGTLWVFQLSVSPPQPKRNLGSIISSPTGVRGGESPGRKRVLVHLELERTHLMATNFTFFCHKYLSTFLCLETNVVDLRHLTQKFPGGPIKFQEIFRRVLKFK